MQTYRTNAPSSCDDNGAESSVGLLLEAGADLNIADNHGDTPLSFVKFNMPCRNLKRVLDEYETRRSVSRFYD